MQEVLSWTKEKPSDALEAWSKSAKEPIALLKSISEKLKAKK